MGTYFTYLACLHRIEREHLPKRMAPNDRLGRVRPMSGIKAAEPQDRDGT